MATVKYGNTVASKWKAAFSYTITTTNTQVTLTFKLGYQFLSGVIYNGTAGRDASVSGTGKTTVSRAHSSGTSWTVSSGGLLWYLPSSGTSTWTWDRGTSAATKTVKFSLGVTTGSYCKGTSSGSISVSVPALTSHKLTYKANGGTGSDKTQTKYYGKNITLLTLASSGFSKANHSFVGWNTNDSATTASSSYPAGGTYSTNSTTNRTLYAIWKANYTPPTISNVSVTRCNSDGSDNEEGDACKISFTYTKEKSGSTEYGTTIAISIGGSAVTPTQAASPYSEVFVGPYNVNDTFSVAITLTGTNGTSKTFTTRLSSAAYPFDVLGDGSAVGIMTAAQSGHEVTVPKLHTLKDAFINATTPEDIQTIVTPASGITITNARYIRRGDVAQIYLEFTSSSDISVPASGNITDLMVGTLNADKAPLVPSLMLSNGNAIAMWASMWAGGDIYISAINARGSTYTITAGTSLNLRATYIVE